MKKELIQKVLDIQQKLKCPKKRFNEHSKFFYRNLEDIENAVKPLLKEHGLVMYYIDEVFEAGTTNPYIRTTLVLSDGEDDFKTYGSAGIDIAQKGMTRAQSFGSSSSYARKYAANAMFLIDDTADDDSTPAPQPSAVPRDAKELQQKVNDIKDITSLEKLWNDTYPEVRGTDVEKAFTQMVLKRKNEIAE